MRLQVTVALLVRCIGRRLVFLVGFTAVSLPIWNRIGGEINDNASVASLVVQQQLRTERPFVVCGTWSLLTHHCSFVYFPPFAVRRAQVDETVDHVRLIFV